VDHGETFSCLVDTGADTSFIDSATAKQMKFPFKQIADGKSVIY